VPNVFVRAITAYWRDPLEVGVVFWICLRNMLAHIAAVKERSAQHGSLPKMDGRPSSHVAIAANASGELTMVRTVDGARLNAADLHGKIAAIRIKCRAVGTSLLLASFES
jgi:hypothetical protein